MCRWQDLDPRLFICGAKASIPKHCPNSHPEPPMSVDRTVPLQHPDRFFIGGQWVEPSSSARIDVVDSGTEDVFVTVAEAREPDIERAVAAAREAFDNGPWPRMNPQERAVYLNTIADAWEGKAEALANAWAMESGVIKRVTNSAAKVTGGIFREYAGYADTFAFQEKRTSSFGQPALLVRE